MANSNIVNGMPIDEIGLKRQFTKEHIELNRIISIKKDQIRLNKDKIKDVINIIGYQHRMYCPVLNALVNEFVFNTDHKLGMIDPKNKDSLLKTLRAYTKIF